MLNCFKFAVLLLFVSTLNAQVNPAVPIVAQSTMVCTNVPAIYSASVSGALSYSWTVFPTTSVALSDPTASFVSVTFPKNLTYTLSVSVETGTATLKGKKSIPVNKKAHSSFNADLSSAGFPADLTLTNYSSNFHKNYWVFSGELSPDSATNTVKKYYNSGSYTVNLIAFGDKGCNDTSSYAFRISDSSSVRVPNVFTPNRDDVNDIFMPETRGITSLNAWIYSREGGLIIKWEGINGFWDGRNTSGDHCVAGVYFVVIEAYGFDGKVYKLKDTITLLR